MLRISKSSSTMLFGCIMIWLMLLSSHVWATNWFVKPNGSSECSGLNWLSPLDSLEEALERANDGDRILIAEGVYTPKIRYNDSLEPCASFRLKEGVRILGGFAGYEDGITLTSSLDEIFDITLLTDSDKRAVHDRDGNGVIESWEFTHETVLTIPEGCIGPVIDCGDTPFEKTTVISGVTIRGGRAVGREGDNAHSGHGGGAYLNGRILVSQCKFEDNYAINGGAIYAQGCPWIIRSNFIRNNAAQSGGAIYFDGDFEQKNIGGRILNCVFSDNGDENSCKNGGGALYMSGLVETDFCTFIGNASHGAGSAVATGASGSALRNSVIWGNFGHLQELYLRKGNEIEQCAVTAGGCAAAIGDDCIMLSSENCGKNGIDVNDNTPANYYPCFVDVASGNYTLGDGSCLIGRSAYHFLTQQNKLKDYYFYDTSSVLSSLASYYLYGLYFSYDARAMVFRHIKEGTSNAMTSIICRAIGAYDLLNSDNDKVNTPLNFAMEVGLDHDLYYGESAKLIIMAEKMNAAKFNISVDKPEILSIANGVATALATGTCTVTVTAEPVERSGEKYNYWTFATCERSFDVTVLPRPLKIKIEDCLWKSDLQTRPQLQWHIQSGKLKTGDVITGEPYCAADRFPSDAPSVFPITAGTLAITPSSAASNYILEFIDGVMKCAQDDDTLLLQDLETSYCGQEVVPAYSYAYGDIAILTWSYSRIGDTTVFEGCPRYPGEYVVTASDDVGREGSCIVRINKATLHCTAVDKYRKYGDANPELTCIWEGFIGQDTPACLDEMPHLSTTAQRNSPYSTKGYAINVTGGSDYRYDIITQDARLYISESTPEICGIITEFATYGDLLEDVWISAYAIDPDTGNYINGEFLWDDPYCMPDAGEHRFTWTFVPDDTYTYGCVSGESTVAVSANEITLRSMNAVKEYGDVDPQLNYAIVKGQLATRDNIEIELERQSGETIGDYKINFKNVKILNEAGRDMTGNYAISYVDSTFTITKRKLTLKVNPASRTYCKGNQPDDPAFTWSITSGSLLQNDNLEVNLYREEGTNIGTYAIDVSRIIAPEYYDIEIIPGVFTIYTSGLYLGRYPDTDDEMLVVSDITYGTRLNGSEQIWGCVFYFDEDLQKEIEVPGHFEWKYEIFDTTIYTPGTHNFKWIFIPEDPQIGEILEGNADLTVLRATLKASLSHEPEPRIYGEAISNAGIVVTLTGFVNDDTVESIGMSDFCENPKFLYDGYDGKGKMKPGLYRITDLDYIVSYKYDIEMAASYYQRIYPAHIVSSNVSLRPFNSMKYGNKLDSLNLYGWGIDEIGNGVPGTLKWDYDLGATIPNVGTQSAQWRFIPSNSNCYYESSITGQTSFYVEAVPLTITAKPVTRKVGEENPAFTLVYSGFVGNDNKSALTEQPTVTCSATRDSGPGIYTIYVTGGKAMNYKITCNNSTLTISSDKIRVKSMTEVVAVGNLTYGQTLDRLSLRGSFEKIDTGEAVGGYLSWLEPNAILPAGYHDVPWIFKTTTNALGISYSLTGTIRIKVAKAVLTCNLPQSSYEAIYGDEEYSIDEIQYKGFIRNEDAGVLERQPVVLTSRTARSESGSYPLYISGGVSNNYEFIQSENCVLVQKPRQAKIIIGPQSSPAYAQDIAEDEICWVNWTAEGILEGDELQGELQRAKGNAPGKYAYNLEGFTTNGNYILALDGEKEFIIERHPVALRNGDSVDLKLQYDGRTLEQIFAKQNIVPYEITQGQSNANEYVYGTLKTNDKEYTDCPYEVGSYIFKCKFTPEDTTTHEEAELIVNLTIEPRTLEITTTYPEISYGDPEHFTGTKYIGTLLDESGELLESREGYGAANGETVVLHWDVPEGKLQVTNGVVQCKPILDAIYLADGRELPLSKNPYRLGKSVMLEMKINRKKVTPVLLTTSNVLINKKMPLSFTFDKSEIGYENEEPEVLVSQAYLVKFVDDNDVYTIEIPETNIGDSYCFSKGTFQVVNGLEAQLIVPDDIGKSISGSCTVTALDLADGSEFKIELPYGLNYCTDINTASAFARSGYPIYFAAGGVYGNGSTNCVSRDCNLIGIEVLKIEDEEGNVKGFAHNATLSKPKFNGQTILDAAVDSFGMSYIACGLLDSEGQWKTSDVESALSSDNSSQYGRVIELDGCEFHGINAMNIGKIYAFNMRNCLLEFSDIGLYCNSGAETLAEDNAQSTKSFFSLFNNSFICSGHVDEFTGDYIKLAGTNLGKIKVIDLTSNSFDGVTVNDEISNEDLAQIHSHLDNDEMASSVQFLPSL